MSRDTFDLTAEELHVLKPKLRIDKRFASLAVGLVALLAPALSFASPVTYTLASGQLSGVQVGAAGGGSPCPIGSGSCLQGGPLALTSASITIDSATGQMLSVSIGLATSGTIVLGGYNGLQSVSFANTSLTSSAISPLSSPQVQGNGNVIYSFGFFGVVASVVTPSGGSAVAIQFPSGSGGLLTVSGTQLSLQLFGVNIGVVCGVGNSCQQIKGDFALTANTAPIPEPTAVVAFSAGLALLFAAARRRARA